ncbi:MAG: hypothetical protein A3A65_02910 [Candidatus Chisholmbacteria bacterium RIFCSPLOWO2_01_FULL_49_14]|uniref:Methionyl-tRNA formyltransferase n=1 Tax=Candidatus Chisholmbacteria bacterium RIFCSPLOWO2_01_FULL_49_14 TaxID=1797593 RepID=A0A1G1W2Z3_9BACT|nr:MAG: hypothetical protein A3A65_02910 [Candidatus Chisholmbacteria bacterium RIFCSPLOWO2_01_FULL_49_14]
MNKPITILIRTYNSEWYLRKALESVWNQTLPNHYYELLIVDDGSTDKTLQILSPYTDNIRLIKSSHIGQIPAINLGLRNAKGHYVVVLDSDDHFEPQLLETMYTRLEKKRQFAFAYSDYFEVNEASKKRLRIHTKDNIFHTVAGGIMFRKRVIEDVGYYDEKLFFPEYDVLLKILRNNKGLHIDKPLYVYRRRKESLTTHARDVRHGLRQLKKRYGKDIPVRSYSVNPSIAFIGCRDVGYQCLHFLLRHYRKNLATFFTLHESLADKTSNFRSFEALIKRFNDIPSYKVKDINSKSHVHALERLKPDLIIQVAWSQMICDDIIKIPSLGCVGFHASLLPKDRGGSPVNWAIIRGENRWGTSMFFLEPGVDNGDIIARQKFSITLNDTCRTVYDKVTKANINMLRTYLPKLLSGTAPRKKQNERLATYNKRRKSEEGLIDWFKSSQEVYNWIRALTHPYPGAFTFLDNKKFYIWKASISRATKVRAKRSRPGDIVSKVRGRGLYVKTEDGVILLKRIQREGGKEIPAFRYSLKIEPL